jgi:predicted ester cyclase
MKPTASPTQSDAMMLSNAKQALEFICSGSSRQPASRYYSPAFVDHVNDIEFHGLAGVEQSVEFYKSTISNMKISVDDQIIQGTRVASRYVVTGSVLGRPVRINGITISHFENELIREDWSVTDTLGLLRQIGVWRALMLQFKQWRATRKRN